MGGQIKASRINNVHLDYSRILPGPDPYTDEFSQPYPDTIKDKSHIQAGFSTIFNIPLFWNISTQIHWAIGYGYLVSLPTTGLFWHYDNWFIGAGGIIVLKSINDKFSTSAKETNNNLYFDTKIGREFDKSILGLGIKKDQYYDFGYMSETGDKTIYDSYIFWGFESDRANTPILNINLFIFNPGIQLEFYGSIF